MKTYTDYNYNEAKKEADATGLPLWDTGQIPTRYLVGHLTIEQEESAEAGDWIMMTDRTAPAMNPMITVDIDLSDDAMGVEYGDTGAYLDSLRGELAQQYPNADIEFTHAGTGRISIDGEFGSGEEHVIGQIINNTWSEWLDKQ